MARIAIINDDPNSAALLADLLEDRGWDVVTCCDGHSAFGLLKDESPDLVVLDLLTKKPEGGWDILTFLQLHPILRDTPVIVSSGPSDELLAKEEWLQDHDIPLLPKPFEIDELYQRVDTALKR